MSSVAPTPNVLKTHTSVSDIPNLASCVMLSDENGVMKAHPVIQGRMSQVKALLGPAINIPVQGVASTISTYQGQPSSSAVFGSTGSSICSTSNTSLASQLSGLSQATCG